MPTARKNPSSIVTQIYDVLKQGGAKTTNEIAIAINSNTSTVKKWVDLIETVQRFDKLVVERAKNITVVRLERKAG
nr:hypothetical protein [Candidatus Sigynarchaeota archaeon]